MANVRTRSSKYKPLLLTTTLRNPERLRDFLGVMREFEGQTLTNDLTITIEGELIRRGLYQPMKASASIKQKWATSEALNDFEVEEILSSNPQNHKEAGFDQGWPSRFETHFMLAKRFGCVYYKIGEPILFSKLGLKCLQDSDDSWMSNFFAIALARYQRINPYQRVLNDNKPLILLIEVLQLLRDENGPDNPGIAIRELPFLLTWPDDSSEDLFQFIKQIRNTRGFSISDEELFSLCQQISPDTITTRVKSLVNEFPDDFLRKVRLTGLFVLRGQGRFIALSSKVPESGLKYLLENFKERIYIDDEHAFFDAVSGLDPELLLQLGLTSDNKHVPNSGSILDKWVVELGSSEIKNELLKLSKKNSTTSNAYLKIIPHPLRLEFLSALYLRMSFSESDVIAHYIADDEGFPISHAPGNRPDLIVSDGKSSTLYEVTLLTGTAQMQREMVQITRHLDEFPGEAMGVMFIAPAIHKDTERYSSWIMEKENLTVVPKTIHQFLQDPTLG